jgi:apolipoprotein N-acyltransferase
MFFSARSTPLANAATAFASGAAFTACSLWAAWLQPIALAVALLVVTNSGWRQAALRGIAFGMGWLGTSVWWLYISLHVYGGMPAPLAVLGLVAFGLYLALFPAAAFALTTITTITTASTTSPLASAPALRVLTFASAWCLSEWLRGQLFTGFPWAASGYAHADSPLALLAPLGGVDSVNFAVGLLAALLWICWRHASWRLFTILIIAYLSISTLSTSYLISKIDTFTTANGTLRVALLQTNIPQEEKFATRRQQDNLRLSAEMISRAQGELIVTPETAVPMLANTLPDGLLDDWYAPLKARGSALLLGIPLSPAPGNYTNSVLGFSPEVASAQPVARYTYSKHHLVPFGEFIPKGFGWFVNAMRIPLGDFERGSVSQPSFVVKGERIAPTICYEDVFGDELRARFADVATAPTMFANLTNLAWFGNTIAIDQHLAIARLRSLEFARPSMRATNTGATVVIDHLGRVTAQLPPWTRDTLVTTVQGRNGLTPYARYGSSPILFFSVSCLIFALSFALSFPLSRRKN